ncbi:hypothetical protein THASP1DRAFT_28599 [Thamnocephalis sphaerospora]|uniref:Kinetochore protein Sos7 coiled-coil domain-containing protein n=1 Tax=Thamnocephalis sphaerospora TaxID=78915 RepID=A0A4P9XTV8_9FUNG|nr:hypothetical protein THASP1DRAFT_28599 [Thamnocephalis sphaerospora]|eukprot:RKP09623.1 hypothetical protein THASP1DRAFT_28599 [Thamnocephalis sphaerospora]
MESLKADVQALQATKFGVDELQEQVDAALASDSVNELYAKLKFSFLEQETKSTFLRGIAREPPVSVASAKVKELEEHNLLCRNELKENKRRTEELSQAVASKETELERISNVDDAQSKRTIREAERILGEQTAELQQVYATTEERQRETEDLRWELEAARKELAQLQAERRSAETFAAEAQRVAAQRDPQVEEMHVWYKAATSTFMQMMGVADFHMDSNTTLAVTYVVADASTAATRVVLQVQLDDETLCVRDASFADPEMAARVPIADAVAYARSRDSLPALLLEVQARVRALCGAARTADAN